ncbi:cupin [Cyanothece sp. BG0011]|uniref:cysteine dioxygenase family protein n=1 Tax=Cyanothece sp. BG0011 TaxID=2082950 RepID=UPI000D1F2EA1|nr:cupin [Cyanothece sp. BG0011]
MNEPDWLVENDGHCHCLDTITPEKEQFSPYRLYRFLTDLENILDTIKDDYLRLRKIVPLVRQLLNDSPWLLLSMLEPNPTTGWDIMTLYDEPSFPLTIQLVAWKQGTISPIHNHGCWGLVALLSGVEKNRFWKRSPQPNLPDQIQEVGEQILTVGDILCFMPSAIHQIEAMGNEPTISFNLYGETDFDSRYEFDPIQGTAQNF